LHTIHAYVKEAVKQCKIIDIHIFLFLILGTEASFALFSFVCVHGEVGEATVW